MRQSSKPVRRTKHVPPACPPEMFGGEWITPEVRSHYGTSHAKGLGNERADRPEVTVEPLIGPRRRTKGAQELRPLDHEHKRRLVPLTPILVGFDIHEGPEDRIRVRGRKAPKAIVVTRKGPR